MNMLSNRMRGAMRRVRGDIDLSVLQKPQPTLGLFDIHELKTGDRSEMESRIRGAARYAALEPHCGLARVLGRYKMFVNPKDDAVSAHIILDGFWEMWNTIFISRFVKPGMKTIEIGANLGYFSLLLSDLIGDKGSVIAFEPLSFNTELLERTMAINGFYGRCTVDRRAVSDKDGFSHIYVPIGNWGGGSIVVGENSFDTVTHEDVETITLDSYCEANDYWPDFIKMDAEGSEQAIWRGMQKVVERQHKLALMVEFDHHRVPNWRAWFGEMEAARFRLYRVGYDAKLKRLHPSDDDPTDMFEVLAVRGYPEKLEE